MLYIGHRGFRVDCDENTDQAFKKAVQLDMDFLEFDVRLSKDKKIFVLHDSSLQRVFGVSKQISEMTSKELNSAKIKSKNYQYPIPTLKHVIEEFLMRPQNKKDERRAECPIKLMIELKGPDTGIHVATLISRYLKKNIVKKNDMCLSGRNLPELKKAHDILPKIPLCLNITSCKEFNVDDLFACTSPQELPMPFDFISLRENWIIGQDFIEKCHQLNVQALTWGFMGLKTPVEKMKQLIKFGIDGILFDSPQSVSKIRQIGNENPITN